MNIWLKFNHKKKFFSKVSFLMTFIQEIYLINYYKSI